MCDGVPGDDHTFYEHGVVSIYFDPTENSDDNPECACDDECRVYCESERQVNFDRIEELRSVIGEIYAIRGEDPEIAEICNRVLAKPE